MTLRAQILQSRCATKAVTRERNARDIQIGAVRQRVDGRADAPHPLCTVAGETANRRTDFRLFTQLATIAPDVRCQHRMTLRGQTLGLLANEVADAERVMDQHDSSTRGLRFGLGQKADQLLRAEGVLKVVALQLGHRSWCCCW